MRPHDCGYAMYFLLIFMAYLVYTLVLQLLILCINMYPSYDYFLALSLRHNTFDCIHLWPLV